LGKGKQYFRVKVRQSFHPSLCLRAGMHVRAKNGLTALHIDSIFVVLTLITIYPFLVLLMNSLGITAFNHEINLRSYIEVLRERQFLTALYNTITMAVSITCLSLVIGVGFAWLLNKTDLKHQKVFDKLIFLTYMVPVYILAIALIEIWGPVGILEKIIGGGIGPVKMPLNIYSLSGVVLVMTLHLYPLAYMPARTYILPTYIYIALSGLKLQKATAMSILLALITGMLYLIQMRWANEKMKIIPGDNYGESKVKLGKLRIITPTALYLFFAMTVILPLAIIVIASFLKVWGVLWIPQNFTLDNYRQILFANPRLVRAICNSAVFGFVAASIATIIGSLAVYIGNRFGGYKGKLADFLLSWPMAVSEVVLAVAAILAWINPPLKLYGTPWIIIVTYVAATLPFVVRNVRGLVDNLDPGLEETAWTFGASTLTGFKKVVVPLIGPGLKTGWICAFLFALHEIPISTLLYAPGTETVGVILFGLRSDTGGLEMISALAVIILLVIIGGRMVIKKFNNPVDSRG
jgi:ABC-type Fe3+ transport system permease subunit